MKFSGVKILQGVEISIFLLIFEWALQQCSATALPVMPYFDTVGILGAFASMAFLLTFYLHKSGCGSGRHLVVRFH